MKSTEASSSVNKALGKRLIIAISELEEVCNERDFMNIEIEKINLSQSDINKLTKYDKFTIYKNSDNKYFVFGSNDDYSMKEQISFWFEILFRTPKSIVKSYIDGYNKLIFIEENYPIYLGKENSNIPKRIFYPNRYNVIDVNSEYIDYIRPYSSKNSENNISNFFNKNIFLKAYPDIIVFTKINLVIVPFILIIVFIIYIFFRKKMDISTKSILELIIILYTLNFGNNIANVILNATIDRYMIRFLLPMYIADILLIGILIKEVKIKFLKIVKK